MTQPELDPSRVPCPICGAIQDTAGLQGHLTEHNRDGGAPNPAPETKAWPPQGIEHK